MFQLDKESIIVNDVIADLKSTFSLYFFKQKEAVL